jgi:hypothetical protein
MKRTIIALLALIFLSSCSANAATATSEVLAAAVPTVPLLQTFTSTPKATVTATEMAPLIDEHDLRPNFTESIEQEYAGVKMKIQIITDESLDPSIKKIFLNPNFKNSLGENSKEAISHAVSYMFFRTWWSNGVVEHTGTPTDDDFSKYMSDWSTAQDTNNPEEWEKVQFEIPKVNDLNDGNGYVTEKITVWPMHSGSAPEGITSFSEFDIAFVRGTKMNNITLYDWGGYACGYGSNLDGNTLTVYSNVIYEAGVQSPVTAYGLVRQFSLIANWITTGMGKTIDQNLVKILSDKVTTNGYKSVFKVDPSSEEDSIYNP